MNRVRSEADVDHLVQSAKAVAVLAAVHELGWLEQLREPTVAAELPGDPRAVRIVLPILAHLGLLDGDGSRVVLSRHGHALADAGWPTGRTLETLGDLSRLAATLRDGGPVRGPDGQPKGTTGGVRPEDPEASRRFLDMLYRWSAESAPEVLRWVRPHLPDRGAMLDLGGGHGRYARTFADAGYDATLFDLPLVVELAKERHGHALSYRTGDFLAGAELGGPYDVAMLSNIVHGQSEEENRGLTRRVADSLGPGGLIVFKDMFLDDQSRDPESAVMFGLTMLQYTARGRSYTLDEVWSWCAGAGLERIGVVVLERFTLVLGRKT